MSISQGDGYEAVFELPDGSRATLPIIVWHSNAESTVGLVNQIDVEALTGVLINYGSSFRRNRRNLVSPQNYEAFLRYQKTE